MTTYAKAMATALTLTVAVHVVGVGVVLQLAPRWASQSGSLPKAEVTKIVFIQPPPPPLKPEPPKIVPPAPVEPKSTPSPPEPPRVEQPAPHPLSSASIAAPTTLLASTAPIPPISSATAGVQVTLSPAQPDYSYNPKPRYPRAAKDHGWEGTTILRIEVGPEGDPGRIEIVQSSGYSILDEASVEAVRLWKFVPARLGDQAIAGIVEVPIAFKLVTD